MIMSKRRKLGILATLLFAMLFSFTSCAPANLAPSIPTVDITPQGRKVFLSAIAADPEGAAVTFEWEVEVNGEWRKMELTDGSYLFDTDGIKKLRVRALDENGTACDYYDFTYDSTNHAPTIPELHIDYAPMKGKYKATGSVDPEGDEFHYEFQFRYGSDAENEWIDIELSPDGEYKYGKYGPIISRVRAVDSYGYASEWTEQSGTSFLEGNISYLNPTVFGFDANGRAHIIFILNAEGGKSDEYAFYYRLAGDKSDGERFMPGYPVTDDPYPLRGILLDPGDHWVEIRIEYAENNYSPWQIIHISVKPDMRYGYIRPVVFGYDRPLYRNAEKVVFESGLTDSEFLEIREKYGSPAGTDRAELNLLETLGLWIEGQGMPVWSYMDESNVLHVVTTGSGLISISCNRMLLSEDKGQPSYSDGWPNMIEKMFAGMSKLKTADLSGVDLSCVNSLRSCFMECSSLTEVIWPDMSHNMVYYLDKLFKGCTSLSKPFIGFPTNYVRNVEFIFSDCQNLKTVDLSGFDFSKCTNWSFAFNGCKDLENIYLPKDMSSANCFNGMFAYCGKLTNPDLSSIHINRNIIESYGMFMECEKLESINCDVNIKALNGNYMFRGCRSLRKLDLRNVNILDDVDPDKIGSSYMHMAGLFADCPLLIPGTVENGVEVGLFLPECLKKEVVNNIESYPGHDIAWKKGMFDDSPGLESYKAVYGNEVGYLRNEPKYADYKPEAFNFDSYFTGPDIYPLDFWSEKNTAVFIPAP